MYPVVTIKMENTVLIKEEPSSGDLYLHELDDTLNEDEELGEKKTIKSSDDEDKKLNSLEETALSSLFSVEEADSCFGLCETEFAPSSSPNYQSDSAEELKNQIKNGNDSQNENSVPQLKRNSLKTDKKRIRRRSTIVITCDSCDYKTTHAGNLKRHMVGHSGEKPYACTICEFRTSLSNALRVHMKVHSSEKSFACEYCDYKTCRSFDLTRHIKKHTGDKPYSCNICDYKTVHSTNLRKHLMNHSNTKPYFCSICDYRTKDAHLLRAHMTGVHTNEKPFRCEICDYKAKRLNALKYHMRSHTGEKPYVCGICDFKTSASNSLKNHLINKHRPTHNVIDFEFVPVNSND